MAELRKNQDEAPTGSKKLLAGLLTLVLWLATIALGGVCIASLRELFLLLYAEFVVGDRTAAAFYSQAVTLGNWLVFGSAVILVVFIIYSGETHLKHYGRPKSWRLLAWALAIELFILGLNFIVHLVI